MVFLGTSYVICTQFQKGHGIVKEEENDGINQSPDIQIGRM